LASNHAPRRNVTTTAGGAGGRSSNNNGSRTGTIKTFFPIRTKTTTTALIGLAAACGIGQHYYGDETNFYDYRFVCDKDPDDLADFYGSENFMVRSSQKKHQNRLID
jgi:hypothetical protein